MKWIVAGLVGLMGIIVIAAAVVTSGDKAGIGEVADVGGQGGEGEPIAVDGAWIERSADGLRVRSAVRTPSPGSYEYPTGDMVPETAQPHPEVFVGSADDREVFTMWTFVFNRPELCTDGSCDVDDLAADAPALGGVFQTDGRIASDDDLELVGSVRLGQIPSTGSPLTNPMGAEVHLAIAPHGRSLTGLDLTRQLNGPLGNPTLWWAATFLPSP